MNIVPASAQKIRIIVTRVLCVLVLTLLHHSDSKSYAQVGDEICDREELPMLQLPTPLSSMTHQSLVEKSLLKERRNAGPFGLAGYWAYSGFRVSMSDFRHLAALHVLKNQLITGLVYEDLCVTHDGTDEAIVFHHKIQLKNVSFSEPVRIFIDADPDNSGKAGVVFFNEIENVKELSFAPGEYRHISLGSVNRKTAQLNDRFKAILRFDRVYDEQSDMISDTEDSPCDTNVYNFYSSLYTTFTIGSRVGSQSDFPKDICFRGQVNQFQATFNNGATSIDITGDFRDISIGTDDNESEIATLEFSGTAANMRFLPRGSITRFRFSGNAEILYIGNLETPSWKNCSKQVSANVDFFMDEIGHANHLSIQDINSINIVINGDAETIAISRACIHEEVVVIRGNHDLLSIDDVAFGGVNTVVLEPGAVSHISLRNIYWIDTSILKIRGLLKDGKLPDETLLTYTPNSWPTLNKLGTTLRERQNLLKALVEKMPELEKADTNFFRRITCAQRAIIGHSRTTPLRGNCDPFRGR